jgi:hypothetical protein
MTAIARAGRSPRLERVLLDLDCLCVHSGQGMQEAENVQKPEHDTYHDDRVQNGFDRSLHRDETVHEPKQHTDHDQDHQNLKYRHCLIDSFSSQEDT